MDAVRRGARDPVAFAAPAEADYGPRLLEALRSSLERLPVAQREVVVLKLWRGAPFAEIALLIGTSEEAARMRFSRGLATLREVLTEEGVDP